ncbi:MAG: transporter substrate-binding protein [Hyphomicrobiales bacterium]|nr:transporter substrate-binding protein [Hyphomicrobiales bacterium]
MNDQASGAALRIICAGGFRAAMEAIAPQFESESGSRVSLTFGTPAKTRELVSAGTDFDLAVVTAGSLDEAATAQLDAATRFTVARSPVGMGLRAGLEKRSISALPDFIAVIESLSSIGLSDPKAGTNLGADILANAERLGFADKMRDKVKLVFGPGSLASASVAKGEIDAVITLASEIITVEGVTFLGAIPEEMRLGTPFVAAAARGDVPPAAQQFLDFLKTPGSVEKMRKTGLVALP